MDGQAQWNGGEEDVDNDTSDTTTFRSCASRQVLARIVEEIRVEFDLDWKVCTRRGAAVDS